MNDPEIPPARPMRHSAVVAFVWGLADATVFFIAPDVYLTRAALFDLRRAFALCAWSLAGALVGASLVWTLAHFGSAPALLHGFRWLPGISDRLIGEVGRTVYNHDTWGMVAGVLEFHPHKLFAAHMGAQGVGFLPFLGVSALGLASRFVATSLIASFAGRLLARWSEKARLRIYTVFWYLFYAIYFVRMH
jgi:hypothetical protein